MTVLVKTREVREETEQKSVPLGGLVLFTGILAIILFPVLNDIYHSIFN